jgi:DNA-binding NarL/FixJ family response regulator
MANMDSTMRTTLSAMPPSMSAASTSGAEPPSKWPPRSADGVDDPPGARTAAAGPPNGEAPRDDARQAPAERPAHERLSNRERQVLCMIGRGLRVRDIADELHLSEKTISTYRTRLLEKLALRTTAQIIRYAIQHDLSD